MRNKALIALLLAAGLSGYTVEGQTFNISAATGLFEPGFRDVDNLDTGNTSWWGWSSGSFGVPSTAVDDPAVTLGVGGLDGTITQTSGGGIVSGSSNIYTGMTGDAVIGFTLPTNGLVGTGFTTLLIQGRTAFGGFNANDPGVFGLINGVSPGIVVANNSNAAGQFWVKYELSGNDASYLMDWNLNTFTSIAELTVDTLWSADGFWAGTAVVPEPASVGLLVGSVVALGVVWWRRRLSIVAERGN